MIVKHNSNQNAIFQNSSQELTGSIYSGWDQFTRFWKMSAAADSLAQENALLRAELKNAKFINTILKDSSYNEETKQRYTYISARVTRNSVRFNNNTIRINRGTTHGIQPHMGVMGSGINNGIVGIVTACSKTHSKIMSLLNRNTRISAELKSSGEFGSLVWKDFDYEYLNMEDVPKHVKIMEGDTVLTSGYSALFPQGIMVGEVDSFWVEPGSNFYSVKVKLVNDLRNLEFVYVIQDLLRDDIVDLEEELEVNE